MSLDVVALRLRQAKAVSRAWPMVTVEQALASFEERFPTDAAFVDALREFGFLPNAEERGIGIGERA